MTCLTQFQRNIKNGHSRNLYIFIHSLNFLGKAFFFCNTFLNGQMPTFCIKAFKVLIILMICLYKFYFINILHMIMLRLNQALHFIMTCNLHIFDLFCYYFHFQCFQYFIKCILFFWSNNYVYVRHTKKHFFSSSFQIE